MQLIQKYIHIELNEALNLRKQKYRYVLLLQMQLSNLDHDTSLDNFHLD